jgi:aspartate kinase
MKVFKFGGASIQTLERIKNVSSILYSISLEEPLLIVVSAMGKTTNALEKVVEAFWQQKTQESLQLFHVIKTQHFNTAKYLLVTQFNECIKQLNNFFTEVEWLLQEQPQRSYSYYYDQIVCVGELLSSAILSFYLKEEKIENIWIDVRDVLKTDAHFGEASVLWQETELMVERNILPHLKDKSIVITQGFIGSTLQNESTTLGREGSDFSAAIFGNILFANSVTIWKDVDGIMSADPRLFPQAQLLKQLSYEEVIEMAYYGAQVIHPKTIKPLQNKHIPLYVKSFLHPEAEGTVIQQSINVQLPPVIIVKQKQLLLHLRTKDFSFISEQPLSKAYELLSSFFIKPNLIQIGAIHLQIGIDDKALVAEQLIAAAREYFDVSVETNLTLLTIRHHTKDVVNNMLEGRKLLLLQQTPQTIQILYE